MQRSFLLGVILRMHDQGYHPDLSEILAYSFSSEKDIVSKFGQEAVQKPSLKLINSEVN